jgi:hypothetical protein
MVQHCGGDATSEFSACQHAFAMALVTRTATVPGRIFQLIELKNEKKGTTEAEIAGSGESL